MPCPLTMMGTSDSTAGRGVDSPKMSFMSTTLKAGSSVLTVCVREMATAAKDRLAAMWPMACIEAGPKMVPNSFLVMICDANGVFGNVIQQTSTGAWDGRLMRITRGKHSLYDGAVTAIRALLSKTYPSK